MLQDFRLLKKLTLMFGTKNREVSPLLRKKSHIIYSPSHLFGNKN